MKLHFTKMEGIGNDYIYFDGINQAVPTNKEFITTISNRHFGVGSDGIVVICSSDKYDFKMRMFNQDGSEAKMCGNGIRCMAKFIFDHQLSKKHILKIETLAGLRVVELLFDDDKCIGAKVNMAKPVISCSSLPCRSPEETTINEAVMIDGKQYFLTTISMGNLHTVIFVDDLKASGLMELGAKIEQLAKFNEGVNVEFVEVVNNNYIKMRVYERGSGETMACGTGACAAMYASFLNGYTSNQVIVGLPGGDLFIECINDEIIMAGPAKNVFEGTIEI